MNFIEFMKQMKLKFQKEEEKHEDSWKTVEIYKLRRFLKQHTEKWLDNVNSRRNEEKEIPDLLDIANYCVMLFHRLKV